MPIRRTDVQEPGDNTLIRRLKSERATLEVWQKIIVWGLVLCNGLVFTMLALVWQLLGEVKTNAANIASLERESAKLEHALEIHVNRDEH